MSHTDFVRTKTAYILKGFPRLSETFIANEIHQMEKLGLSLGLFSIKPGEMDHLQPVMKKIKSSIRYSTRVTTLSKTPLWIWLLSNSPAFVKHQKRLLRTSATQYFKTLGFALCCAWKYRRSSRGLIKKTWIKEFLLATEIACGIKEEGGYARIHAHFCHDATNVAWMVSMLCSLPFSFTAHAKDIYQQKLNPGDLLHRKLEAASFVVTCTGANQAYLQARCSTPEKVVKIYHGLDLEFFHRKESPLSSNGKHVTAPKGPPLILSVGRFVEKKGFAYLIEACRRLVQERVRFRCIIMGEPGETSDLLAQMIRDYELNQYVELRGPLPQDQLAKLYAQASVFALPCVVVADGDRDGIPNVVAEAMAMQLPVVSTDVSGLPEIITHGREGLLLPSRNAEALAAALQELLGDDEKRGQLGKSAREKIMRFFDTGVTHLDLKTLFERELKHVAQ